jgi:5-methyltetrahydropteroyltriglutamate--homocysteine methyltransferase
MFETTIAGSLPKPGWLAETGKLWPAGGPAGGGGGGGPRGAPRLWG